MMYAVGNMNLVHWTPILITITLVANHPVSLIVAWSYWTDYRMHFVDHRTALKGT
jgi:hypothetical protein